MWVPTSEAAIRERAQAGDLTETAIFEGKRELPPAAKSRDLAIDVAALANEGGVILYGLGEDAEKRLIVLAPFPLAGVAERIDSIVRTAISEPPTIAIKPIPSEADPTVGYVAVVVPPSPRAPHMVVKDKDHRYYGRSATGNVRLTEGEVARLYERRQRWEVDREALLDREIARSSIPRHEDFAFLHLVARPVVPDDGLLDRAKGRLAPNDGDARRMLTRLLTAACEPVLFPRDYAPDLGNHMRWMRVADGFRASDGYDEDTGQPINLNHALTIAIDDDGSGHLFCGRAAARRGDDLAVIEPLIVGLTVRFLALLGRLYAAADYLGPVDTGVAVVGVQGAVSAILTTRYGGGYYRLGTPMHYDRNTYRRTGRFAAGGLLDDPHGAARSLTERLYRTTSGGAYEPFAQPSVAHASSR
jgi:hypothetical protein